MRQSQKHEKSTKIKPSWKNLTIFEENPSISMSSKIFVKIHAVLRKLPYCPCALLPMCPIAHVPHPPTHPQGPPSLSAVLTNKPFTHVPMCPIAHVPHYSCVKKMSSCQKDVKLSKRSQMSKNQTHRLWRRFTKKINWHNEVHTYWRQFWHQIWRSPKLFKNTFYAHFEGFWWSSYVTSKIDINMCEPHYVNLFFLWTSSIVYVFDYLTFDIFLTFWHIFDNF